MTPYNLELRSEIAYGAYRTGVKVMAMTTCLTLIHLSSRAYIHIQRNKDNMTVVSSATSGARILRLGDRVSARPSSHSASCGCVAAYLLLGAEHIVQSCDT